ncbi:hypothetical protein EUGRSUZ_K02159 [Eucalyptus grandis]|uniref:Uncharacterized protein n=2 Tax=Eucalyptus grandis TaxID=71139 RepID=A0ACC3IVK8_EUCGR|nr:hypothetical protein EUGRSUZ_K02159 [Eucalyptus grandis]
MFLGWVVVSSSRELRHGAVTFSVNNIDVIFVVHGESLEIPLYLTQAGKRDPITFVCFFLIYCTSVLYC